MKGVGDDQEELEALREALTLETPTHKLACWRPPVHVPGVGWIAEVTLFSTATYQGPRVDVILAPARASVEEAREFALEAAARVVELGLDIAMELPLAETLGLVELDPRDAETLERLTSLDTIAHRRKALAHARERFAAIERRFAEVYGLRLPRSLIGWAALLESASPLERAGLERLGRSGGGIMVWFEHEGLERATREGLDPRLESRFRRDPPELVTIAWGDSDGLHYGLWFDDPAEPATTIVANYARDSAETWDTQRRSMLELLREQLDEAEREDEAPTLGMAMLGSAIEWFLREGADADEADPPSRWAGVARPDVVGSMGPALRLEHGQPEQTERIRYEAYQARSALVDEWIERARVELDQGRPAFALVLGRELHWFDADEWRAAGLELLVAAYRALGRDALAEIAWVHHRHRDLQSVAVY